MDDKKLINVAFLNFLTHAAEMSNIDEDDLLRIRNCASMILESLGEDFQDVSADDTLRAMEAYLVRE